MISTKNTTITSIPYKRTSIIQDVFALVNNKIEKEKENAFGITVLIIMISTMIASVSAALAIYKDFSFVILAFTLITSMGTNAAAFSQSPFKYVVWAGIISIVGNTFLVFYQLFLLL